MEQTRLDSSGTLELLNRALCVPQWISTKNVDGEKEAAPHPYAAGRAPTDSSSRPVAYGLRYR